MSKSFIHVFMLLFLPGLMFAQGFKIEGTRLLDDNDNEFIMKGFNVPLAWFQSEVNNNIASMKTNTGANSLRIVVGNGYTPQGGTGQNWNTPDNVWQTAVERCIENEIVPVIEVHNVLGSNVPADIYAVAEWWASKASFLTREDIAPYILINIANEWGDWWMASPNQQPAQTVWRDTYINAVKTIRDAGIKTTLIIDAPNYGQDVRGSTILNHGLDVLNGDPEKNVLFSVHMYCEWSNGSAGGGSNPAVLLPQIKNAGIPISVGEFAFQHATDGNCDINVDAILSTCESNGIGWLAWSWKGNGNGLEYMDLSNNWSGTSLSTWGNRVINGANGTKTGATASVFITQGNAPIVAITSPAHNTEFVSGSTVIIQATASAQDGSITAVEFYEGDNLLGSDQNTPYSYTWENIPAGTYRIKAVAENNQGIKGSSAFITIVVKEKCLAPELGDDQVICPGNPIRLNSGLQDLDGRTFVWERDGIELEGETGPVLLAGQAGLYKLTVNTAGCASYSGQVQLYSGLLEAEDMIVCRSGDVILSVTGGVGPYEWYSDRIGGEVLYVGENYTAEITGNTTYYIKDAGQGITAFLGLSEQNSSAQIWNLNAADITANDKNIRMTVLQALTLEAVSVYSALANNAVTIRILEGTEVLHEIRQTVGTGKQRILLNIELQPGEYTMDANGTTGTLRYQAGGADFPYVIEDLISFTGTQPWVVQENRYGLFYAIEVATGGGECGRTPVSVTVDTDNPLCVVTSVADAMHAGVMYFPNPFAEELTLEMSGDFTYEIIRLDGNLAESGRCMNNCKAGLQLLQGVYMLKMADTHQSQVFRVVKK